MVRDIQGQAFEVMRELGDTTFKASNEWARKFLKRNDFSVRGPASVGQPDPDDYVEKIESFRKFYSEVSDNIDSSNIGDFDEVPVPSDIVAGRTVAPRGSDAVKIDSTDDMDPELIPTTDMGATVRETNYRIPTRGPGYQPAWSRANARFRKTFIENEFGHKCDVCDRIWFRQDLKKIVSSTAHFLANHFPGEDTSEFELCSSCNKTCRTEKIPPMSRSNGYMYPPKPSGLPKLDPISERLVSPRIPYMQIRRLRRHGCYGIIGQVINVPVDVKTMVQNVPRDLDDDHAFNVNLKKSLVHKSSYLSGYVKKSTVKAWLQYLIEQPLYKRYDIKIDWHDLENRISSTERRDDEDMESLNVEDMTESELINARQQTMMWNEDSCLDIAPGQHSISESLIFDTYAEELSFPAIYFGFPRTIKPLDNVEGQFVRLTNVTVKEYQEKRFLNPTTNTIIKRGEEEQGGGDFTRLMAWWNSYGYKSEFKDVMWRDTATQDDGLASK
ncbi:uncharacterized protein LOC114828514 [Galendromus occidentalis]|uniref:Uncharacterized protein LOC114828514 n=1 Tax=Galendromus occidentalis TaxID=34638 RepID=A0AAJ7WIW1_9ACAR|nr:uncharacterized protein LOC114828514 [Galendromus occidentalis]